MGKKKAVRSVPAQIVIGSAADLGFMLALTAIRGGAHAWRRDRAGEYPDSELFARTHWRRSLEVFLRRRGFRSGGFRLTLLSVGGYLLLLLLGNLLFVGAAPTDGLAVCLPPIGAAILAALLVSRKPKTRHRR